MIQVLILPEAELELREIIKFYEEKCSGLGLNFLREIESGLKTVKNLANLWQIRKDGTRRYLVHRFPYLVVYNHKNDSIWIITFAHCKRKPEYWRNRIRSVNTEQKDD